MPGIGVAVAKKTKRKGSKKAARESAPVTSDALTERQRRFVENWLGATPGNGTRSAQAAGYSGSVSVLAAQAYHLLRNPKIKAAIDARIESDPMIVGRVERLRILSSIARGELTTKVVSFDMKGQPVENEEEPP